MYVWGLPRWLSCKESTAIQKTWVQSLGWEDPLEEAWQPTPVFLPGESHGQSSLAGYSPWGRKASDTTECILARLQALSQPALQTGHFTEDDERPGLLRVHVHLPFPMGSSPLVAGGRGNPLVQSLSCGWGSSLSK